jgi:hypothetical protein
VTTLRISEANAGDYQVELMTIQGQVLSAQSLQISGDATLPIDLSTQSAGLYLLRVSNGERSLVRRVIKR